MKINDNGRSAWSRWNTIAAGRFASGATSCARRQAPFGVGSSQIFDAYASLAELRCFDELDWPLPNTILDPYAEFKLLSNGRRVPAGYSLAGALTAFGLDSLDAVKKEGMRALALRGFPYTAAECQSLLDYCAADVYAVVRLLAAMEPYLDFPRAFCCGLIETDTLIRVIR
jgi:DNA polymerase-1